MAYIIMDIDGVLNPTGAQHNPNLVGFIRMSADNAVAYLNPETHVRWINELSDHAQFIWGSAWAEQSNLILEMLNLPDRWDHIPLQYEDVGLGTWKIKPIRRWVEALPADERIVWIDDDLEPDAFAWAEQRGNMLAIQPAPHRGMTEEDFQSILTFLTE